MRVFLYEPVGKFDLSRGNTFTRVVQAWASALSISAEEALGLVHVPQNAYYLVTAGDDESQNQFFSRASYLKKLGTNTNLSKYMVSLY
ncbi:MAG: YagK/YfjJ domain-containing protein [Oceanisphaera sp.]